MKKGKFRYSFLFFLPVVILFYNCRGGASGDQSAKFQQYFVQGEQLYLTHCSNCHQKDGSGLGLLYPPVNQSDFMEADVSRTICVIRNGISGELIVNGRSFNKPMEGIGSLTDLEIAEISTYLYNSWDRNKGLIDVLEVSEMVLACE